MIYVPSPPPASTPATIGIMDWLRREFQAIANALRANWDMPVTSQAPEKAREGSLRYADGTAWNPGGGKGLYVYNGTAWVKL